MERRGGRGTRRIGQDEKRGTIQDYTWTPWWLRFSDAYVESFTCAGSVADIGP